ncbi:hypothetical protein [Phenylobacterium sp.]|uniref:hypothetical protein n=1 Tax=Phenylobacterium sp. TaxID=1871053 RepID=UPI00391BB8F0
MAGFSIEDALKSGFRLARREWKAVLAWGLGTLVLLAVTEFMTYGGVLPEYMRVVGDDPEAAQALIEKATEGETLGVSILAFILNGAWAILLYGAVARAVLRPQDRRFFYLRLGRGELWLTASSLVAMLLIGMGLLVVGFAAGYLIGFMAGVTGLPNWQWGVLIGLPVVAGVMYVLARFFPIWIQAFDEERFVLLDAWRLTRGQGWRIVLLVLALLFMVLILFVMMMLPLALLIVVLMGLGSLGGAALAVAVTVGAVLGLGLTVALYGLGYTVAIAPYVEVYRRLKASA